jgi:isoleucyl-tRNA synthetase
MRREMEFEVVDRINIVLETTDRVREVFNRFDEYIRGEVLAVSVEFKPTEGTAWDLNGEPTVISIHKR